MDTRVPTIIHVSVVDPQCLSKFIHLCLEVHGSQLKAIHSFDQRGFPGPRFQGPQQPRASMGPSAGCTARPGFQRRPSGDTQKEGALLVPAGSHDPHESVLVLATPRTVSAPGNWTERKLPENRMVLFALSQRNESLQRGPEDTKRKTPTLRPRDSQSASSEHPSRLRISRTSTVD